jgi:hypothetical protein
MVGYRGLPQGSVLSPFLYNVIGSCADRFVPPAVVFYKMLMIRGCMFLIGWFRWLVGLSRLLARHWVFSFVQWVSQYPLQSPRSCCFPENTSSLRFWLESGLMFFLRPRLSNTWECFSIVDGGGVPRKNMWSENVYN